MLVFFLGLFACLLIFESLFPEEDCNCDCGTRNNTSTINITTTKAIAVALTLPSLPYPPGALEDFLLLALVTHCFVVFAPLLAEGGIAVAQWQNFFFWEVNTIPPYHPYSSLSLLSLSLHIVFF